MKIKHLLMAGAISLCTCSVQAQQTVAFNAARFQRDFANAKTSKSNSVFTVNQPVAVYDYNEEKYRKFKKMKTGGIILTAVGAGLITTGVVLISNSDGYSYDGDYYSDDDDKIVGGAVCIVMGVLSTGGGITMWAIGNRKMKKYGGGSLSLKSTKSGLGVAYSF